MQTAPLCAIQLIKNMKLNTLHIYYLATPVFFILHYYFDINLRLSIPDAPESYLYTYYLICFLAGFIVFKSIVSGAIFSLIESSINIFLLLLGVMLPIFTIGNIETENTHINFGTSELIHFFIVGFILIKSFYLNPLITGKLKN